MGMMGVMLPMCHAMGTNDLGFPRTGPPRRACPPVARRDRDPLPPAEDTHTRERGAWALPVSACAIALIGSHTARGLVAPLLLLNLQR